MLTFAAVLVMLPWLMNHERRTLDFNARLQAPYQLVELADGWVHYRREGEIGRPAVVLLHGFKRAALSTIRHSPLRDDSGGWIGVGKLGLPVLLVWGREDVSFRYANHIDARRMMPQAKRVTVEAAAHLPQYEQPQLVNAAILEFFAHGAIWLKSDSAREFQLKRPASGPRTNAPAVRTAAQDSAPDRSRQFSRSPGLRPPPSTLEHRS